MFTLTFVLYERPGVDRAEALRHWREDHAPLVAAVPGVVRYVQQHAIAAPDGSAAPFLGVAFLSFADRAGFESGAGSAEFAAAIADVALFADAERLPTAVVEEVEVV